jgi:hypothetical protein
MGRCLAVDNALTTLATAYTHGVSTSFTVSPGKGSLFGTPSASSPIRVTAIKVSAMSPSGQLIDLTKYATYRATSVVGDVISGLTLESGTDQDFTPGDVFGALNNAAAINDLNGDLSTLDAAAVKVTGDQVVAGVKTHASKIVTPQIDHGTQGGTLAAPNPQTLLTHQPIDSASFGPWQLCAYGGFSTVDSTQYWDPVLYLGYNPNRDPAAPGRNDLPTSTLNIEARYVEPSSGKTTSEFYFEYLSAANDGVNRFQVRPIAFTLDQATGSVRGALELGPYQSGWSSFGINAGPGVGGAFTILQIVAGVTAAASSIQLLSPTVSIGTHTVSDVDGGSSGTLIFGNDNQPTRSLAGTGIVNLAELQMGSAFGKLRSLNSAIGLTIQSDAADAIDAVTINASVTHTSGAIWKAKNNGSTLAYVDPTGLTATNLSSNGTLTVAADSTFSGVLNSANSGADGIYVEVQRIQIAGNLGPGNWRHSLKSSLSSSLGSNLLTWSLCTSQTTQTDVLTLCGDKSVTVYGPIKPAQLADSSAPNGSLYFSTTAGKLVYKDGSGVVNPLY